MKIGDTIRMEEPPLGTVLLVHAPLDSFLIRRYENGWQQVRSYPQERFAPWRSVISAWGPGADSSFYFEVVELP